QSPLQPVCEPRDHALQAGQLAVEIGAQAIELLEVAQLGRLYDLVELVGEDLVVERFGQVGPRAVRAHGHHALLALVAGLALAHLGLGLDLLAGLLLAVAVAAVAGNLLLPQVLVAGLVVLALLVVFAAALALAVFLVAPLLGRRGLYQLEVAQHVDRQRLERPPVVDRQREPFEVVAGAALDVLAHQLDTLARGFGHRLAGQLLAQHQRERGLDRDFGRVRRAHDRIGGRAQLGRRGEVLAHARIVVLAERLVAHAFDRVVAGARLGLGGHAAPVERLVVVAQPEREAVGKPACFGRLVARQRAARHRHAQRLALHCRSFGGPGDLGLRIVPDRPRGAGQRGPEAVEGRFVGHVSVAGRKYALRRYRGPWAAHNRLFRLSAADSPSPSLPRPFALIDG